MNSKSAAVIIGSMTLGLFFGYQTSSSKQPQKNAASTFLASTQATRISGDSSIKDLKSSIQPQLSPSTESLESLIAKGPNVTYAEMAVWLVDASALEIAAYWRAHQNDDLTSDSNGDLRRLIFFNWTRLDPQAAIAAVAGTKRAMSAWHAWGANDPQAALAAANPEQLKTVANGIGQMQPEWLREHFEEIPKDAQRSALNGVITWTEDSDLEAKMDFLMANGMGFSSHTFGALAQSDPWAAYEWLEKNHQLDIYAAPLHLLLDTMKSAYPEDLERMAAMTSSTAIKRKIEDTIFANLLAADPKAALAKAKSIEAPLMSAKRLATVGSSLLSSDPEQAFQIGADILAASPGKLDPTLFIECENGFSSRDLDEKAAEYFMESLMIKDPSRTLNMTITTADVKSETFETLANLWAKRDLGAYAEWVNQQADPQTHTIAAKTVIQKLSSQGHFHEAAEWVLSGRKNDPDGLDSFARYWGRSNPQEALEWVESTALAEEDKASFRNRIDSVK